ncbi:DUF4364 family protein [Guggenheimella bovis]
MKKDIAHYSQIERRLTILYTIQSLGGKVSREQLKSLFQDTFNVSDDEWQKCETDIFGSDLVIFDINSGNNTLSISDEGLVVMSFFLDRLPEDVRIDIDNAILVSNPEPQESLERFLDQDGYLHLDYFENHERLVHLMIKVDPEISERLLSKQKDPLFREDLIRFLLDR